MFQISHKSIRWNDFSFQDEKCSRVFVTIRCSFFELVFFSLRYIATLLEKEKDNVSMWWNHFGIVSFQIILLKSLFSSHNYFCVWNSVYLSVYTVTSQLFPFKMRLYFMRTVYKCKHMIIILAIGFDCMYFYCTR